MYTMVSISNWILDSDLSIDGKMRQNDFLFIFCIMFILFSGIIIGFYLAMREMTSRRLFLNQNIQNYSDSWKR